MEQEPIPLKVVLIETLRFFLKVASLITLVPLLLAVSTHWVTSDDGSWVPWPIDASVWWQGWMRLPIALGLFFIPWIGVRLAEASPYFLLCCGWVAIPWWTVRWLVRNYFAQILRWGAILSVGVPLVPLLIAWLYKLAWYVGNWWSTGTWDASHVFVQEYPDSYLAAAERLKFTKYIHSVEPYRTVGMQPDWDHWLMGTLHFVQCLTLALVATAGVLPLWWTWRHIHAQARRRIMKSE